jgi:sialate O-acetylesterase
LAFVTLLSNLQSYADHCTFPALIADWRDQWFRHTGGLTDPMFPFGFVSLTTQNNLPDDSCIDTKAATTACNFAAVRWGQTANYGYVPNDAMPNTFMAMAMDLGDHSAPADFPILWHPRYKKKIGQRLANAAMAIAYGQTDKYWSGPIAGTDFVLRVHCLVVNIFVHQNALLLIGA